MTNLEALSSVSEVMHEVGAWWAVAGGWAIDLWLGFPTRPHHDVEVVVRTCDLATVSRDLGARWKLYCLDPPGTGWRPWNGKPLEPPAFQLQARSSIGEFDIFAETADETEWQFRRDNRITRAVSEVTMQSASGIPIVRPEVQLLYMAGAAEPKNEHDFQMARPTLDLGAASWLAAALAVTLPRHHWIATLR